MDIRKCLTISLDHITQETREMIEDEQKRDSMGLTAHQFVFGYFVYCSEHMIENHKGGEKLPEDLWKCMLLTHQNDCRWLCLDCEGEKISTLETY